MYPARRKPLVVRHPGLHLALEDNHIVVSREGTADVNNGKQIPSSIPLSFVSAIVLGCFTSISSPLVEMCMRKHIPVFFSSGDDILGSFLPSQHFKLDLILAQVAFLHDKESALPVATKIVRDKISSQIALLRQHLSNYSSPEISCIARRMTHCLESLDRVSSIRELMGKEGIAAADYWKAFSIMLPEFRSRSKNPAVDPVNAMLSYGYAVLAGYVSAYAAAAGFNLHLGFLHAVSPRRPALVYDLIEPFRVPLVDRIILNGFHRKRYKVDMFLYKDGRFYISATLKNNFMEDFCKTLRNRSDSDLCYPLFSDYIESIMHLMLQQDFSHAKNV